MQGIHTHIPQTNDVPREYIVAVILSFFMAPLSLVPSSALLCFYISTFRSMCAAHNMAVYYYYYYYYYYYGITIFGETQPIPKVPSTVLDPETFVSGS
jgi:hypothetical protein